jgi:hypothetical protein
MFPSESAFGELAEKSITSPKSKRHTIIISKAKSICPLLSVLLPPLFILFLSFLYF